VFHLGSTGFLSQNLGMGCNAFHAWHSMARIVQLAPVDGESQGLMQKTYLEQK
jgi:hypothetical protein